MHSSSKAQESKLDVSMLLLVRPTSTPVALLINANVCLLMIKSIVLDVTVGGRILSTIFSSVNKKNLIFFHAFLVSVRVFFING
ncbi:hypothetical protein D3C80_1734460 [compost metagenome]